MRAPWLDRCDGAADFFPAASLVPSLLGWFAADAANVKPGATVVVVGDGAVGLLGVLSANQMGAERIIAMSRHEVSKSWPASSARRTL